MDNDYSNDIEKKLAKWKLLHIANGNKSTHMEYTIGKLCSSYDYLIMNTMNMVILLAKMYLVMRNNRNEK